MSCLLELNAFCHDFVIIKPHVPALTLRLSGRDIRRGHCYCPSFCTSFGRSLLSKRIWYLSLSIAEHRQVTCVLKAYVMHKHLLYHYCTCLFASSTAEALNRKASLDLLLNEYVPVRTAFCTPVSFLLMFWRAPGIGRKSYVWTGSKKQ